MKRYPESYADKEWIDAVCRENNDWDLYDRLIALSGVVTTDQEITVGRKRNGDPIYKKAKEHAREKYREIVLGKHYRNHLIRRQFRRYPYLIKQDEDFERQVRHLPDCSFSIHFLFKMKSSYISRDDSPFYIIDNPVRKDKVFKIPMVSASQWKGSLHGVMARQMAMAESAGQEEFIEERLRLISLFGSESSAVKKYLDKLMRDRFRLTDEQVGSAMKGPGKPQSIEKLDRSGRLRFYPSFFDDIGLEVINPHDRKRKVGKNPIYIESAPCGAGAGFAMLYVPFDLMGLPFSVRRTCVAKDLAGIAAGVFDLFTQIGFGGKISSGFGIAEPEIENGRFVSKGLQLDDAAGCGGQKAMEKPRESEFLKSFVKKHENVDFSMRVSAFPGNKKKKAEFRRAKADHEKYQKEKEAFEKKMGQAKAKDIRNNFYIRKINSFEEIKNLPEIVSETSSEKFHGIHQY